MEKSSKSDKDKEEQMKKLQEKIKERGTKLQTSIKEYRKKIEVKNDSKSESSTNKSQSPALSSSSSSSYSSSDSAITASTLDKTGNEKVVLDRNKADFSKSTKQSDHLNKSRNCAAKEQVFENKSIKNDSTKAAIESRLNKAQNNFNADKEIVKEKIDRIKCKISRFERNNCNDSQRYQVNNFDQKARHRSNSERSSNNSKNEVENKRQRSISGNFSTVNSEVSSLGLLENNIEIFSKVNEVKSGDENEETERKTKKRSRGKRGGKNKTKETQANAEHIPIYAKECDSLYINAETLLILDLLYLPQEQHFQYLIDVAKARKILIPSDDETNLMFNPVLKRFNSILQLGNSCRNLTPEDLDQFAKLLSKDQNNAFSDLPTSGMTKRQIRNKERNANFDKRKADELRSKVFEDYVNEIVTEYLPEDKKDEFSFKRLSRRQRHKNYFMEDDFEAELEKYAQKLVNANLGVIVEGEIRVNGKNNEQSFVKNVTGKKDAFIGSMITRKYALHGDIVRIFVRNDDSEKPLVNLINEDILQQANINDTTNLEKNINKSILEEKEKSSNANQEPIPSTSNANESLLPNETQNEITENPTESSTAVKKDIPICNAEATEIKTLDLSETLQENSTENVLKQENITNSEEINENQLIEQIEELDELNNTLDLLVEQETEQISDKNFRAFVIKIVEKVHNRKCVGNFLSYRKDCEYITFVPRDLKMPNIRVYKPDWPEAFKKGELQTINDVLYVGQITEFQNGICIGKVLNPIGKCGELESENKAILLQNGLEMDPYEDRFNEMFFGPLIITDEDLKIREDLRKECIFTIDPLTARDLDDALSCKTLPNGNYEIGVHISDVTHFLEEKSELDEIVALRSTSVYLVNEVFHMLPKPLCFKCSLLPGEDKFAFSCFWEVEPNSGEILSTRMSRTILNSCTQFAYEHAQKIIDNPDRVFVEDDFPQIHNGWTVKDIVDTIKILNIIAEKWRQQRFDQGALKINRPKLYFHLNPETGEPTEYFQAILSTANYLIEEFMLKANQSVADFIYKKFPKIAFLRNHEPPLGNVIQKVQTKLKGFGLNLDISSSKSIFNTLSELIKSSDDPLIMEVCLTHLISKPMTRAKYFCSENATTAEEFWHYALSIPIYTHFTSPIRRYPDILVHRVLAAALGYTKAPQRSPDELHAIAAICNEKKYTAKLAGEDSSNLYFMHYIKTRQCVLMKAAVIELFARSMEVVLIESGHQIRIAYPYDKSNIKVAFNAVTKTAIYQKETGDPSELKPFSEIEVEVYVDKHKIKARLPGTGRKLRTKSGMDEKNDVEKIEPESVLSNEVKVQEIKSETDKVIKAKTDETINSETDEIIKPDEKINPEKDEMKAKTSETKPISIKAEIESKSINETNSAINTAVIESEKIEIQCDLKIESESIEIQSDLKIESEPIYEKSDLDNQSGNVKAETTISSEANVAQNSENLQSTEEVLSEEKKNP